MVTIFRAEENQLKTAPRSGREKKSSEAKQRAIVAIENDDNRLDPAKTFVLEIEHGEARPRAVIRQPQTSGMPKSNCSAIAEPTTSARSQAAMAISQRIQRNITVGFE